VDTRDRDISVESGFSILTVKYKARDFALSVRNLQIDHIGIEPLT